MSDAIQDNSVTGQAATATAAGVDRPGVQITYGTVELDVTDLDRTLAFWRDGLGLTQLERRSDSALLGSPDRPLIEVNAVATRPQERGRTGLYHVALHLPDEAEFARVLVRAAEQRLPQAPTDHIFSKATYLTDPDGIGVELTVETPERCVGSEISGRSIVLIDELGNRRSPTEPLDVGAVLRQLPSDGGSPFPAGSIVGHVHLHVRDLEVTRRFYRDVVGFTDHMFMESFGMADLAAGDRFPHRLAFNVWNGPDAQPPSPGAAGLRRFTLELPAAAVGETVARLERVGATIPGTTTDLATSEFADPSGNRVRLVAREPSPSEF